MSKTSDRKQKIKESGSSSEVDLKISRKHHFESEEKFHESANVSQSAHLVEGFPFKNTQRGKS
jgi:hypothetical protein